MAKFYGMDAKKCGKGCTWAKREGPGAKWAKKEGAGAKWAKRSVQMSDGVFAKWVKK